MARKMISALKEIVGESVELEERRGRIDSALMNENRLAIFQFLCRVPGSSIQTLSKHFGLSVSTIKWHLDKLIEEGYVAEVRKGGKLAFFPDGMLDPRCIDTFCVLNEELPVTIFLKLLKGPGLSQKQLGRSVDAKVQSIRSALRKLERLDLILSVVDGRYRRYYPTDEVYSLATRNRKKVRQFRSKILKRLKSELLNPQIILSKTRENVIQIDTGLKKVHLTIATDILTSILSYYADRLEGDATEHQRGKGS